MPFATTADLGSIRQRVVFRLDTEDALSSCDFSGEIGAPGRGSMIKINFNP